MKPHPGSGDYSGDEWGGIEMKPGDLVKPTCDFELRTDNNLHGAGIVFEEDPLLILAIRWGDDQGHDGLDYKVLTPHGAVGWVLEDCLEEM